MAKLIALFAVMFAALLFFAFLLWLFRLDNEEPDSSKASLKMLLATVITVFLMILVMDAITDGGGGGSPKGCFYGACVQGNPRSPELGPKPAPNWGQSVSVRKTEDTSVSRGEGCCAFPITALTVLGIAATVVLGLAADRSAEPNWSGAFVVLGIYVGSLPALGGLCLFTARRAALVESSSQQLEGEVVDIGYKFGYVPVSAGGGSTTTFLLTVRFVEPDGTYGTLLTTVKEDGTEDWNRMRLKGRDDEIVHDRSPEVGDRSVVLILPSGLRVALWEVWKWSRIARDAFTYWFLFGGFGAFLLSWVFLE